MLHSGTPKALVQNDDALLLAIMTRKSPRDLQITFPRKCPLQILWISGRPRQWNGFAVIRQSSIDS